MSFVTASRDYVETLNTISTSLGDNFTLMNFFSETALYVLKTLQSGLLYIVSFQWIRDFSLLPIVLPQFSLNLFKENFFLETPSKVFFEFLEIPDLHQNKFLLGFFNSFFLCLPFSVVHIVTVRRLLIQGIPSGIYSIGGYLVGQILFLTLTIFGCRQILIPWLTLEPFNYILGLILIFRIIYSMTRENLVELKGWSHPKYQNFFLTSFVLAWCEQTSIFQYLGNLTLSSNVTILESFSSTSPISSFLTHFIYICGIVVGSILFTTFWGFFFLQLKQWCFTLSPLSLAPFLQRVNKATFVFTLALSLTSIPFYGFDYLLTGPLGFVSQDKVFEKTILGSQTQIEDYKNVGLLSGPETNFKYISSLDPSPFDRGVYLQADAGGLSFEEMNYRGEFDWTTRLSKLDGIASETGLLSVAKILNLQNKPTSEKPGVTEQRVLNPRVFDEQADTELTDFENDTEIVKRFHRFYGNQPESEDIGVLAYKALYKESFPAQFLQPAPRPEQDIEHQIKQKYYSNPVYKTLLALDIDLFLKRQPQSFNLNSDQEVDLYTKRRILETYYESLREYSNLPYLEVFDSFFDGAKSFSNKVYNQQFKGTLYSVNRLFTLQLQSDQENTKALQSVLKFDQPLYEFSETSSFSPYHEELGTPVKSPEDQLKSVRDKFDGKNDFFTKPLYAGWDENLRKFVITNKFIPRGLAGYKVAVDAELQKQFTKDSSKQNQQIRFTAWPLRTSKDKMLPGKNESSIPYVTLYSPASETAKRTFDLEKSKIETLPANLEYWELRQSGKQTELDDLSLAPRRGGFIWPGNSKIDLPVSLLEKFQFKKN